MLRLLLVPFKPVVLSCVQQQGQVWGWLLLVFCSAPWKLGLPFTKLWGFSHLVPHLGQGITVISWTVILVDSLGVAFPVSSVHGSQRS